MTSQDPFPHDTLAADITTTLESTSRKRGKKVLLILVLISLLLGAGYYVKRFKKEDAPLPVVSFKTAPAMLKEIVVTVTATGTLEPTNQVEVGSELSGTVKAVLVDYNDRVRVGQVLARLDVTDRLAQVRRRRPPWPRPKPPFSRPRPLWRRHGLPWRTWKRSMP